jgi:hypothetical protein
MGGSGFDLYSGINEEVEEDEEDEAAEEMEAENKHVERKKNLKERVGIGKQSRRTWNEIVAKL